MLSLTEMNGSESLAWSQDSGHRPRVLVVDDCRSILDVVAEVLRLEGFEVLATDRPQDVLHFVTHAEPADIVLCDIMMPQVTGVELHAHFQKSPTWVGVPFIFLSALSDPGDVRMSKTLGCDDYLTKPFDPDDLLAVVKGKIVLSRQRRKLGERRLEDYRRRIVHTLSHEFRTPLVSINTGTELLLDQDTKLDEHHVHRLLESVRRGGLRLQRLVDDFMLLQQIDWGQARHSYQSQSREVPFLDLIERAIEDLREAAMEDGASEPHIQVIFGNQSTQPTPRLRIHETQIVDALRRILNNSLKFGGADKPIRMTVGWDQEKAWVEIQDQGPGMSPGIIDQARQVFTQIGRDRFEQQGCGLGLPIACYFVELNRGAIFFREPEGGVGSIACIHLPRIQSSS